MRIVFKTIFQKILKTSLKVFILALLLLLPINSLAASFDFNPSSAQFTAGCRNGINIMVDATNRESNAADIELYYNPNEIEIVDSVANIPGTQIRPGDAYETYFGNDVNNTTGRIRLAGASFVSSLNSRKVFATIEFTSRAGVTATSFNIQFDGVGATLDSNIAESSTSDDLLSSVTNGSYSFRTGDCVADRIPPVITFQSPPKYGVNIPLNQNVIIRITDNQSGVDLSRTTIDINGDIYNLNSPEVSYTGSLLDYTITINPRNDFINGDTSMIRVITSDIAGNRSTDTNVFNIPIPIVQQTICPNTAQDSTTSNPSGPTTVTNNNNSTNPTNLTNSNSNTTANQNAQNISSTNTQNGLENSSRSNIPTDSISNLALSTLILARTGGSLKDLLLYNYWWGIPLLILILIIISARSRWLQNKDKTKLN